MFSLPYLIAILLETLTLNNTYQSVWPILCQKRKISYLWQCVDNLTSRDVYLQTAHLKRRVHEAREQVLLMSPHTHFDFFNVSTTICSIVSPINKVAYYLSHYRSNVSNYQVCHTFPCLEFHWVSLTHPLYSLTSCSSDSIYSPSLTNHFNGVATLITKLSLIVMYVLLSSHTLSNNTYSPKPLRLHYSWLSEMRPLRLHYSWLSEMRPLRLQYSWLSEMRPLRLQYSWLSDLPKPISSISNLPKQCVINAVLFNACIQSHTRSFVEIHPPQRTRQWSN